MRVVLSLTPTNDLFQPGLYVSHPTLRSYVYTMGQDNPFVRYFWQQLLTSLTVSLWTMLLVAAIAAMGSFAMARMKFRFRRYVSGLTLFTYVIPSSFLSIPFFKLMADYDLIDTKLGLVLIYAAFNLPFTIWMMKGFVDEVPAEYEEAAMLDGYSRLESFVRFTLPLLLPGILILVNGLWPTGVSGRTRQN